jgi:small subunit ribosomal protein S3
MGQKVNPKSLRIGIIETWDSKWYANKKNFAKLLHSDIALKKFIIDKLKTAGITKVEIERSAKKVVTNIYAAKPGLIIGRQGVAIEDLRDMLSKKFNQNIEVNILEIPNADLSAQLLGELVASQIEKRIAYRRAAKMAIQKGMEAGAIGVKILVAGRLNGVEIARKEFFKEGNVPLHTLRANIDYASVQAVTTYGTIGIKVWVYKGMIFKKNP